MQIPQNKIISSNILIMQMVIAQHGISTTHHLRHASGILGLLLDPLFLL